MIKTSLRFGVEAQAKRLRERLRSADVILSHSEALELVAHQQGAKDWNTLRAMAGNRLHLRVRDRVKGRYLGQPFNAVIRGLTLVGDGGHRRVTLQFDAPVTWCGLTASRPSGSA